MFLRLGHYIKHYVQCGFGDNIYFKERKEGNYILISEAEDAEIAELCGPSDTIYYDGTFGEQSRFGRPRPILWVKDPKVIDAKESLDVRCSEWRARYPLINGNVDAEHGKAWARRFHQIAWSQT